MAWTREIDGTLTHTGTDPEAWMFSRALGEGNAVEIGCLTVDHRVGVLVFASEDGRNGWMIGVFGDSGADASKLSIRRIVNGAIEAPQTGGDAPNDATPVAHGLASGVPYILRVEIIDGRLVASLRGALVFTTVTVAYLNDTSPTFILNTGVGVWSTTNNARVTAGFVERAKFDVSEERELLVTTSGGDLRCCFDGVTDELIARDVVPKSGTLVMAEHSGVMFIAGQNIIKVFDPQTRTVVPYVPTAGVLPGQSGLGSYDSIGISRDSTRLVFAMRTALIASAVDDPYDVDVGSIDPGGAFDFRQRYGQAFGEDITMLFQATDGSLVIGTTNAMFTKIGDPIDGTYSQLPVSLDAGPMGWHAAVSVGVTSTTATMTSEGLVVFSASQGGSNISRGVVREGLNTPRETRSQYAVSVVRDSARGYLFVFRTALQNGLQTLHHAYDETQGGYAVGSPAWFPLSFATAGMNPTRAVQWRGRVVLGCADGQVREFDDALSQDDGVDFPSYFLFTMVDEAGVMQGVHVEWVLPELDPASPTVGVKVYGGDSPSKLMRSDTRQELWSETFTTGDAAVMMRQRANAVGIEIYNLGRVSTSVPRDRFIVEQLEAKWSPVFNQPTLLALSPSLEAACRPLRSLPAPAPATPADPFAECGTGGDGPNPDNTDPVTGTITVTLGATTATGQFVQPTATVTGATGSFTYDWTVDGFEGSVWTGTSDGNPPTAAEVLAGLRTIRVTITGGTLRTPLILSITVLLTRSVNPDPPINNGDGVPMENEGQTGGDTPGPNSQYVPNLGGGAAMLPPSNSCSISTDVPPSVPTGYGAGTYTDGWL